MNTRTNWAQMRPDYTSKIVLSRTGSSDESELKKNAENKLKQYENISTTFF